MAGVCGRDCEGCGFREEYGCRGCLETGGNPVWGECRVVRCCHGRGLYRCGECPSAETCAAAEAAGQQRERFPQGEAARREREAERLAQEAEREAARRAEMARKAPILAKWLLVLFWLNIASMALNLVEQIFTGKDGNLLTNVISIGISVAVLVCYWQFSKLSRRFRSAWRCEIAALVVALLALLTLIPMLQAQELGGWAALAMLLALVSAGVSIAVLYQFCEAMAEQLDGEDQRLADNWRLLRKWTLGSLGALLGCILLALIIPTLGMLVLLGATLVLVGCSIAQLVLTWQSARFFRERAE